MVEKDYSVVVYILGIVSIVMVFLTSFGLGGIIFGIIGILQSKKQNTEMSNKGKRMSIIGLILGVLFFVVSVVATILLAKQGTGLPI